MLDRLGSAVTDLGRKLLSWRQTTVAEGRWEGDQFKARADVLAHEFLISRLTEIAPEVPVISEEDMANRTGERPGFYFLIDPIDGTASYAGDFNGFVTQVAVMEDARPIQAVIFAPALDQLYSAEVGAGTTLNGQPVKVSDDKGRRILIDNYPEPRESAFEIFQALHCTRYLECGSIALKICRVADGTADLFFKDIVVRDWDLAAPNLVLAEAGGTLVGIDGAPIAYGGDFEKPGVIAAGRPAMARRLVEWFAGRAPEAKMEAS